MLEGLKAQTTARVGKPCKIIQIAEGLDDSDRAIYLDAIADEANWTAFGLEMALKSRGIWVSNDTIQNHRRGVCPCGAARFEQ